MQWSTIWSCMLNHESKIRAEPVTSPLIREIRRGPGLAEGSKLAESRMARIHSITPAAVSPSVNTTLSNPGESDSEMKNGMSLECPESAWMSIDDEVVTKIKIHVLRNVRKSSNMNLPTRKCLRIDQSITKIPSQCRECIGQRNAIPSPIHRLLFAKRSLHRL